MSTIAMLKKLYSSQLPEMKKSNKAVLDSHTKIDELNSELAFAKRIGTFNKNLSESLQTKNREFIDSIIVSLEEAVEYAVNSVLPIKKYNVQLTYVPYRNNGTLKLYLIDSEGNKLPPRIIEGDMLNQVLSFSAVTHLSLQMGYNKVFYDEAFASANVRSLVLIRSVIDYYTTKGVQFILVTQNPVLYAGLNRTMIELVSDGLQIVDINKFEVEASEEVDVTSSVIDLFDSISFKEVTNGEGK